MILSSLQKTVGLVMLIAAAVLWIWADDRKITKLAVVIALFVPIIVWLLNGVTIRPFSKRQEAVGLVLIFAGVLLWMVAVDRHVLIAISAVITASLTLIGIRAAIRLFSVSYNRFNKSHNGRSSKRSNVDWPDFLRLWLTGFGCVGILFLCVFVYSWFQSFFDH